MSEEEKERERVQRAQEVAAAQDSELRPSKDNPGRWDLYEVVDGTGTPTEEGMTLEEVEALLQVGEWDEAEGGR